MFAPAIIPYLSFLLLISFIAGAPAVAADKQASDELVDFVDLAAKLIEEEGEKSFPKFRVPDSKWFHGDRYVFVWGLDGMRYVYPPDTSGEGINMLGLKDINGKPIGKWIVGRATFPPGHGWLHYQWPLPGEIFPSWKSTYIERAVAPSGKAYLVGSGNYNMPLGKAFVLDLVRSASRLLKKEGMAGFDRLRDKSDEFAFMDTYVFVLDANGKELVNPAFPNLEGRNLVNYKDAQGKLLVKEMLDGLGWNIIGPDPVRLSKYANWPMSHVLRLMVKNWLSEPGCMNRD